MPFFEWTYDNWKLENGCNGPTTCTDNKESKESINMPPISEE